MRWKKFTLGLILGGVVVVFGLAGEIGKLPNGKLRVVVCDVGQGDAIYLKTPKGKDILIDGGPDEKVLDCLSGHMPFWDRNIEMVFLTHPHADHLTGLISVLERYSVGYFFKGEVEGRSPEYAALISKIKDLRSKNLSAGDRIKTDDGVEIEVLWPAKDFVSSDLNQDSLVLKIGEALFMGDAASENLIGTNIGQIYFLKVPHHGSRTGLTAEFLERIRPKVAAISVGKNNRYGHPAKETLEMLQKIGAKILRTDREGEVVMNF